METSVRVKKEKVKLSGKVMCVTKTKVPWKLPDA